MKYIILDNNTPLKYIIIFPTSIHRVARHGTFSRQTPARLVPKVCATLIQCWPTIFDVGKPLIRHVLNVVHLLCSYHYQGTHKALSQCWLTLGKRHGRWANIKTASSQGLQFAGDCHVFSWIVVNDVADIIQALAHAITWLMSRPHVFAYSHID